MNANGGPLHLGTVTILQKLSSSRTRTDCVELGANPEKVDDDEVLSRRDRPRSPALDVQDSDTTSHGCWMHNLTTA